ncbi:MAG TPA: FAD:protein FMN transferase [Spirochaetales bacterium]|nr:FAD:protein FMN transferase [Spirochaetales bacterium]
MKRLVKLGCLAGAFCLLFCACASKPEAEVNRSDFVLGTVCSISITSGGTEKILDEAFARLREIENRMSANKEGTEIAAINEASGKKPVTVTPDTFYVISKALEYAQKTNGAFDPTVEPLVKLWNIGSEDAKVPPLSKIKSALALIDYKKVQMDPDKLTVYLPVPGMRLDLGAIAKGYAADEIEKIMVANKVKSAIIDLGGNVFVYGKKKDGTPWRVGIQNPYSDRGEYIGLVTGGQMTVVTSGVYERYFIENGKRYHHILDTKTGFPVDNGLISVSIVTESSIDADALSTSVFALGLDKGMKLVESLKDVYAIFIDSNNKVYLSPGTNKIFTLTDNKFSLSDYK